MLPTGHEGPYSLESLQKRKASLDSKIWAEGLSDPVTLKVALERTLEVPPPMALPEEDSEEEIPPPLPVDEPEAEVPSIPEEEVEAVTPTTFTPMRKMLGLSLGVLALVGFGLREWVKSQEEFSIKRPVKMGPTQFQKVSSDFKFEGWDKKIFFKEYMAADMSHIWLVTSAFYDCKVEASFQSLKGKLLSQEDEKVFFKTSTHLKNHIAEFSKFEFMSGNRIIPGLYEMDLKAQDCSWDGIPAHLANLMNPAEDSYVARMKVVLYHQGSVEFNAVLDKLIRKKLELEIKNQNQEELFWMDLQEKLQTLNAISIQIEQLLLDFTDESHKNYSNDLKQMVDKYTKNFGRFLTDFVVANEKYFLELDQSELSNLSQKRSYETVVRLTAKNIGLESMKIIEELQTMKKPDKKQLTAVSEKVKKQFEILKEIIARKIIQVSEDRSKLKD